MGERDKPFWQFHPDQLKKGELHFVDIAKLITLMRTLYQGNPGEFARYYHGELWRLFTGEDDE